jgi:hypothetical protein
MIYVRKGSINFIEYRNNRLEVIIGDIHLQWHEPHYSHEEIEAIAKEFFNLVEGKS